MRTAPFLSLLSGALALAACAVPSSEPVPPVPPLAGYGGQTPERNAISGAAEAFGNTGVLLGKPADAAVAVSRLEWTTLAVGADRTTPTQHTPPAPAPDPMADALTAAGW